MTKQEKQDIITEICEKVAEGDSVRKVLRENKLICRTTFYEIIDENEDLANQYIRACALREELIFDDILNISDKQDKDVYLDKDKNDVVDHNVIARSRLMVDSRKWMLGKMNPKKYGDISKLQVEGGDPNKPIIFQEVKTYDSNEETD